MPSAPPARMKSQPKRASQGSWVRPIKKKEERMPTVARTPRAAVKKDGDGIRNVGCGEGVKINGG